MRKELEKFEKEFNELKINDNNNEFWLSSDLMNFLGYKSWDKFFRVIIKAMDLCLRNEKNVNDLFIPILSYDISGFLFDYNIEGYKLNKNACYLIFMEASDKYDNVRLGKEYIEYKKISLD